MTDSKFILLVEVEMRTLLKDDVKCFKCDLPAMAIIRFVMDDLPICVEHLHEQVDVWIQTYKIFVRTVGGKSE